MRTTLVPSASRMARFPCATTMPVPPVLKVVVNAPLLLQNTIPPPVVGHDDVAVSGQRSRGRQGTGTRPAPASGSVCRGHGHAGRAGHTPRLHPGAIVV